MYNTRKITDTLTWVGAIDRKVSKFENIYKLNSGMNYNSYFLDCGATVLIDTVEKDFGDLFIENIDHCLSGRTLDYVIIHHMEPDHSATLALVLDKYSEAKIIVNAKTLQFISQFFPGRDYSARAVVVKDGDETDLGTHKFKFVFAPMVHWPEVMMSFDETDGILFSADAFGSYGAINGSIFADDKDFDSELKAEARRYYTNIVGKYGMQTVAAINKVSGLDIKMICPLHSYVWRENIGSIIGCYKTWGTYTPEEKGVFILAGSIYGHTANAAEVLMTELDNRGIKSCILDASAADISDIIAMAFKYSHIVIASPTYNNGIYPPVDHAVRELASHGLTGRSFSVIENGTWAPASAKGITAVIEGLKNCRMTGRTVTLKSSGSDASVQALSELAEAIREDMDNN